MPARFSPEAVASSAAECRVGLHATHGLGHHRGWTLVRDLIRGATRQLADPHEDGGSRVDAGHATMSIPLFGDRVAPGIGSRRRLEGGRMDGAESMLRALEAAWVDA